MLKESQRLHYVVTEVQGPSITVEFSDCKASLQLPMEKVRWGATSEVLLCSKKIDFNIKYTGEPVLREEQEYGAVCLVGKVACVMRVATGRVLSRRLRLLRAESFLKTSSPELMVRCDLAGPYSQDH